MTSLVEDGEMQSRSPTAAISDYLRQSISVSYILGQIWTGRLLVVAGLLLGLTWGVYVVWTGRPSYMATMRVSPAESDLSGGGGGGGAGSLIADITGGANAQSLPKFTQFIMSIGSPGVAEMMNQRYDMLCRIYHGDCNPVSHKWRERTGWRESIDAFFAWLGHLPDPNGARTIVDLANYTSGAIVVDQNKQNAVATLTYSNPDPKFAEEFLSRVIKSANDYIKLQNHDVQRRYVDYLTASAAKTANVEQRQAIDALLLQEERQLMLTEVDVPYAAQVMDGPTVVPVNDVRKKLAIYTLIGILIGGGLAACRNLMPHRWRFW